MWNRLQCASTDDRVKKMWFADRAGFYSAIKKKIITFVGKGIELERSAVKGSKSHLGNTNITNKHSSTSKFLYTHIDEKRKGDAGERSKRAMEHTHQESSRPFWAGVVEEGTGQEKGEDGRAVGSN